VGSIDMCQPRGMDQGGLTPRVSVVLPVVRGGPLFDAAVASVLNQTFSRLELIIVINGSATDVRMMFPERVRVVREKAMGLARARNRGLSLSRGEFVAFLDEDDLWRPEKLERQVALLDAEPNFVGCQTLVNRIDVSGRVLGPHTIAEVRHRDVVAGRAKYLPSSWCLRREAVIRVGSFDGAQAYSEDLEFLGRITMLGALGLVTEPLTLYRIHQASNSRRFPRRQMVAALAALNEQRREARAAGDLIGVILGWRGHAAIRYGYSRQTLAEWQSRHGWGNNRLARGSFPLDQEVANEAELTAPSRAVAQGGQERRSLSEDGDTVGVSDKLVTSEPAEARAAPGDLDTPVSPRLGLTGVANCGSDRPLVSVVLPTHTGGRLFEEALASVLSQEWSELEVLVVDNGAALDRVALEGRDPRVSVLAESLPGASVARNRALGVARGAYIAFLDHDDLWRPEKLQRQIAALEADPTAVLGQTGGVIVDDSGREIKVHPSRKLSAESLRRFRVDFIFSSVVVRRDAVVATGGFRPRLRLAQDIDYLLRLLELGGSSFLTDPLVSYRWHSASSSQSVAHRQVGARLCLQIAARQRELARLHYDRRAYLDAWIGTAVVRTNAARDALYIYDDRWGSRDWFAAARALGSAIGFNPVVPVWVGLKALRRRIQHAAVRRPPGSQVGTPTTGRVEDAPSSE